MKEDADNRRSFLQKLTALASTTFIPSMFFSAKGNAKKVHGASDKPAIKKIKALGFQWKTMDPFLFCVHHEDFYPRGNSQMGPQASLDGRQIGQDFLIKDGWRMYHGNTVPGFPGHPHRGFETITVVQKGMVDHTDSMGAAGRYGDGDVQWMTSGKGIQHAEMFPLLSQEKDNPMELFQLWLNLPKANKFVEPHFKMLWGDSIPNYQHHDQNKKKTEVSIIAGEIGSYKAPTPPPDSWAADPNNEVAIWNIRMESGAKWDIPKASAGINRTIYFFKGSALTVNGQNIEPYHAAELDPSSSVTLKSIKDDCHVLLLQGRPISEPVVQHGPFVMNTKAEIQQAFSDYQRTKFGGWPWPVNDPVHPRGKGRFALHADGKEEIKG